MNLRVGRHALFGQELLAADLALEFALQQRLVGVRLDGEVGRAVVVEVRIREIRGARLPGPLFRRAQLLEPLGGPGAEVVRLAAGGAIVHALPAALPRAAVRRHLGL